MVSSGARFLAAFNEIENHFRSTLGVNEHVEFAWMVQEYSTKKHLPRGIALRYRRSGG